MALNAEIDNFKRTLTLLDKSIDRLVRANYRFPHDCPDIYLEITDTIQKFNYWIDKNGIYDLNPTYPAMGMFISELGSLVNQLWITCKPKPGKKALSKKKRNLEQHNIYSSIIKMLETLAEKARIKQKDKPMAIAFNESIKKSFFENIVIEIKKKFHLSLREVQKAVFFHGAILMITTN